jgi:hypothetical protein
MTTETNIIRTIINKFEGRCYRCGCTVRRGNGLAEQVVDSRTGGTKWQNRHDDGCCYTKADGMGWVRDNAQWERKTGVVIPLPEAPKAEVVEAPKAEVVEAPKAEVVEVDVFAADALEVVEAKPARRQSRKTYGVSHRHCCDQDWIDMLNDADPSEAELAAAEAEVEAAETAEAAEIAASEAAIETATETVSDAAPAQTLELYRLTVRCSDCCRRTKSLATEIAHYPWCTTLAQDPELLRTLQDKIAMSLDKRRQTKAAKLNAKIDELREAYSAVYASVGGNSALGIHKINGSTGLHTVRAYEGTCTCPGHKAHGHCKHVRLVRDARDAMQSIKRQLQDTSDRLLVLAERATYANCEW